MGMMPRALSRFSCVLLFSGIVAQAAPSPLPAPNLADYTLVWNGGPADASSVAVSGIDSAGHIYLSGIFTAVNGIALPGLVRIDWTGAVDTSWIPAIPAGGTALGNAVVEDGAGRIIVRHSDLKVYRIDRTNGASVQALAPAQCVDMPLRIAVDWVTSDIYVACSSPGVSFLASSAHVYRFAGGTGLQDPVFDVTLSGSYDCISDGFAEHANVYALAHDGAGHLYIGGNFRGEGSAGSIRNLVRVSTPSGALDTAWRPLDSSPAPVAGREPLAKLTCFWTPAANPLIEAIVVSPGGMIYAGGYYTSPGRSYIARYSATPPGAADSTWNPVFSAEIATLGLDLLRNRIYAGGHGLVAFSTLPGATIDTGWQPSPNDVVRHLFVDRQRATMALSGDFTQFGFAPVVTPVSRQSIAGWRLAGVSVTQHYYQSILGRGPDGSGVDYWAGEILRLTTTGAHANEVYMAMAMYFFSSPEFAGTPLTDTQFVERLYLTFFDRAADAGGRDYWVGQIASGLTREMVMYAFMFSSEFGSYMAANLGDARVMRPEVGAVIDFYRGALARLPDTGGLRNWVNAFRNAQCSGDPVGNSYQAAIAISDAFFTSAEYAQRSRNTPQYVSDLYNAFMRRSADVTGFTFWVNALGSGASSPAVRQAFIATPEFAARVQAIAGAGCVAPMP